MNALEAVDEYKIRRELYKKLTRKIYALLKKTLKNERLKATFEKRTKSVSSFRRKITQLNKNYSEPFEQLTDLSGVRVIVFSNQDVERVASVIRMLFVVDEKRSVNKIDLLEPDRFGYLSQQFIVKANAQRSSLPEYENIKELWSEIQVRTVLQHAWAVVDHVAVYRSKEEVPKEFRRRLSRLMALFELADQELDNLIKERGVRIEEYKSNIAHHNLKIEINVDSVKSYIRSSSEVHYWQEHARNKIGINVDNNYYASTPKIVETLQRFGFKTIEELDRLMLAAHGWGEHFIEEYYDDIFERDKVYMQRNNKTRKDTTQSTDTAVLFLVIASLIDRIIAEGFENDYIFGSLNLVETARKFKNKTY